MADLSEKLKGLKFMQRANKNEKPQKAISFSTIFCKKTNFIFQSQQNYTNKINNK